MSLSAIVEALVDAGATPQMILAAVRAAETSDDSAIQKRRRSDAERQRRKREKQSDNVMSRDDTVTERDSSFLPPSVSPRPPSTTTNLSPEPPYSPPAEDVFAVAWKATTPEMRKRSKSQDRTRPIWRAEARKAGGEDVLLLALRTYLRSDPDVQRTGGPGFDRWLRDGKWEQHLPKPEPPAEAATPAVLADRIRHYRETGEWRPIWGQKPEDLAA